MVRNKNTSKKSQRPLIEASAVGEDVSYGVAAARAAQGLAATGQPHGTTPRHHVAPPSPPPQHPHGGRGRKRPNGGRDEEHEEEVQQQQEEEQLEA